MPGMPGADTPAIPHTPPTPEEVLQAAKRVVMREVKDQEHQQVVLEALGLENVDV